MVPILKPVDNTPICDPDYLRRIDPVWTSGRVPKSFWNDAAHRRDYLLWLAHELGFGSLADLYRLEFAKARVEGHGATVIKRWGGALGAVQDCFPEYDWKPWLFPTVPKGFWDLPANRRNYWDWLGRELAFRSPEAWYRIRVSDLTLLRSDFNS